MPREPQVTYVVPENLTEELIAEARQSLIELARILGRATGEACHKRRIDFDMDDPQVARDVITAAIEGLVLSRRSARTVPTTPRVSHRQSSR